MLAQRTFTRPATSLRRGFQLQRRFIHPSRPQLQPLPRPNTWLAKLRFRADGESRSTIVALHYGIFILFCWISIPQIIDGINSIRGKKFDSLARMIYFQETDIAYYDSVNFDDPISTASYFAKLLSPYGSIPEKEFNQTLKDFMRRTIKTEDGSTQSAEVQMHYIMRLAAEKIHNTLRVFTRDLDAIIVGELCVLATLAVGEAMDSILNLVDDPDDFSPTMAKWKVLSD